MWRVYILVEIYSLLVYHIECAVTEFGDPIGPLGPIIVEKPNNLDDDVKVVTDAIAANPYLEPLAALTGTRTAKQRLAIDAAYLKASGKNISTAVKQVLNRRADGPARELYEDFYYSLPAFLAHMIHRSLVKGASTDDWTYMSIICTSSATKLKAISDIYMTTSCEDNRLRDFLVSASFAQIKLVVDKWNGGPGMSGKPLANKMKERKVCPKGLMQEVYKRIVRYAALPYEYLAVELELGMHRNQYNSDAYRYIITARSEIDLKDILAAFI